MRMCPGLQAVHEELDLSVGLAFPVSGHVQA
jgi:hypothetical protein